jgi:hypothetical protein
MSDAHPEAPSDARPEAPSDAHPEGPSEAWAPAGPAPGADSPPERSQEPGQPQSSTTADPRVDDALSRLSELEALPLSEQVEVYTDIHRRLAGVLSDPDSQA